LSPEWRDAAKELGEQLARIPSADCRGIALTVEPAPGGARVTAVSSDGARTERTVSAPASLVATGLGLAMSVPRDKAEPSSPASARAEAAPAPGPVTQGQAAGAPAAGRGPVEPPTPPAPPRADVPRDATRPGHRIALSVGFEAGARVAVPGAITMVDLEAHATIAIDRWVLLVFVRDAPGGVYAEQGVDADAYQESGAGLGVGRRVEAGGATFDLAVVPSLVATRMEVDIPPTSEVGGYHGNDVQLRVGALARMSLPLTRGWTMSVSADTDVAPGNLTNPARIEVPASVAGQVTPFPSWTTGVHLGVSGALL
jgi:hypothetical protein